MFKKKIEGHEQNSTVTRASRSSQLLRLAGICVLAGGLAACAQRQTMYSWGSYQPEVYSYLKVDGPSGYAAQAQILEKNVQEARSQNKPLPPGFQAHLGMLYLEMGEGNQAIEKIEGEKRAFPESASFMDFLLRNAKKPISTDKPVVQSGNAQPTTQVPPTGGNS